MLSRSAIFSSLKKLLPSVSAVLMSTTCIHTHAATYYNCNHEKGCKALDSGWSMWGTGTHAKTKYPIVLSHGAAVFNRVLGINSFYGIPEELSRGGAQVFQTLVPAINSSETRAEIYLRPQLETALAISGADKLNLTGHSQGGLDSRYISHTMPDKVATVTTISSPHSGNVGLIQAVKRLRTFGDSVDSRYSDAFAGFVNAYGYIYKYLTGVDLKQDSYQLMETTTIAGFDENNKKYPNGFYGDCTKRYPSLAADGIHYFSIGNYGLQTNALDPFDVLLSFSAVFQTEEQHDGLVETCGMHLGYMIRDDYYLNHIDSVNHLFGLRSWRSPNVISIYRNQASRLKQMGK